MRNNNSFAMVNGLFGKLMTVGFLSIVLAGASYAQSGNLYEYGSKTKFGFITVYPGTVYHIVLNGGYAEIKIYQQCKAVSSGGIAGVYCPFTEFINGRANSSGYSYVFQNGYTYLRWLHDVSSGYERPIDSGWHFFTIK